MIQILSTVVQVDTVFLKEGMDVELSLKTKETAYLLVREVAVTIPFEDQAFYLGA